MKDFYLYECLGRAGGILQRVIQGLEGRFASFVTPTATADTFQSTGETGCPVMCCTRRL